MKELEEFEDVEQVYMPEWKGQAVRKSDYLALIRELKIAKKIIDNEAKKRVLPDLWKKSMYEDATREMYPETEQPK
jgi:hypothetical protein